MGIRASELRIGNLVIIGKKEDTVFNFVFERQSGYVINNCPVSDLEPIPITEEWLVRFGFEKINHLTDGIIYKKDWLRITEHFSMDWRGGYIKNAPAYLHQLQNLYFALTGNELEIKPPPHTV